MGAIAWCASFAAAQHPDAATEIFPFLNLNYDARSVAMAGASVALPNDGYGGFSNPASLGFVSRSQAMLGYRQIGGGIFGAPLAYIREVAGAGTYAVGGIGMTGDVGVTDIGPDGTPFENGQRARSDCYAGHVSWASRVNEYFAAGVALKGVYNYLSDGVDHWSADGVVLDCGVQYRSWNSRLVYGFALHNVGILRSGYEDDDSYPLPVAVELGVSYVPRYLSMVRLALDLNKEVNDYLLFEPGVEFDIIARQLVARAGYAVSWRDMRAFMANLQGEGDVNYSRTNRVTFTAGFGVNTELFDRTARLDAAMEFSDVFVLPAMVVSVLTDI